MLPETTKINGACAQIQGHITALFVVTVMVVVLISLLRRADTRVKELRVEIDQVKKDEQVAAIVDTDYFQELRARVQEMRGQSTPPESPEENI